jgi:serine/threonine-protein kinase HipA
MTTPRVFRSVNGKFKGFELADLQAEAARFCVGSSKRVVEEVRLAIREWSTFAQAAEVSEEQAHAIQKQLLLL